MLSRRTLAWTSLLALSSAVLPSCLLDAGPYEGATNSTTSSSGHAGSGGSTSTGGGTSTTAGGGGTTVGGGGTGGTTVGGGGTGGVLTVDGDECPGIDTPIALYQQLVITQGDTTLAKDDYGSNCGGGTAGDVVYAVTAGGNGTLRATLLPDGDFDGFVHLRTACTKANSEVDCGPVAEAAVSSGDTVYVIVDGHANNPPKSPTGTYELDLFLDGCGNGTIEATNEECDDANSDPNDHCDQCNVVCTTDGSMTTNGTPFEDPVTHHCYLLSHSPNSNWEQAANDCTAWGGYLAVLATQQEIDSLASILDPTIDNTWIGASDQNDEGTFVWVNGEPWLYTDHMAPWDPPEPNNVANEDCVEIYNNGRLNDAWCTDNQNWLCERPPAGTPAAP